MQNDHIGTPQQLLNPEGAVVHRQRMEAYGRSVRNGEEQSLRFAGQVEDAHSGTYYNFHRNYEARSGSYTQWDPIGIKGGVNVYGYVAGNALRKVDPLGLKEECADCKSCSCRAIPESKHSITTPTWYGHTKQSRCKYTCKISGESTSTTITAHGKVSSHIGSATGDTGFELGLYCLAPTLQEHYFAATGKFSAHATG